jgi:hypothetical protein
MIRVIGLLSIVTVMATHGIKAQAHITTGNELLNFCQSGGSTNNPDVMTGMCYGYISGTIQVYALMKSLCPSELSTNQQFRDIVVRHLENHPETRDQIAPILILDAAQNIFPCK